MNNHNALLPYQRDFLVNPSRFKIGLWARQTGKDYTCTAEAVLDCLRTPGTTWLIVAAGERQAIESLEKAKEWAEIFRSPVDEFTTTAKSASLRSSSTQIKWINGSRIIALPAKPETIRGYSANVILTEFAFYENPEAIWRAIYPSISNPLRGGQKKLRIISTPNGLNNKFAHLWFSTPAPNPSLPIRRQADPIDSAIPNPHSAIYHRSRLTIHDAIRLGLPLDAAELRSGLNDEDAWSQEYLCEFTDNSKVLLPYDLIESCESSVASETSSPQSLSASILPDNGRAPELFAGIDFARKNHLTVCWILERVPNPPPNPQSKFRNPQYLTREVLCLHNLPTPAQVEILLPRLRRCRAISLDYTGPGVGLGDYLAKDLNNSHSAIRHSPYKYTHRARPRINLELCQFTTAFKSELFPRLRAAFENREIQVPSSRDIREDLHSLYSTVTNTGQVIYRAPCTPGGHADRATALALALRAAQSAPPVTCAAVVRRRSINDIPRDPRYQYPERTLAILY